MNSRACEHLLGELRAAVNRDHRRRRRKVHALIAVSVVALLIGSTVSAATLTPWWARSKPERVKATILVRAELRYDNSGFAAGSKIALWRAPDQAGGTCLLLGALKAGVPDRAGECESNTGAPIYARNRPIAPIGSSTRSHGVYEHVVIGSVDPTSTIVRVVLARPTGSTSLAFTHGWFLGDTAPTPTPTVPNAYVVGYDRHGHEVARVPVWKH